MKDTEVAVRYARALFGASQAKGESGQVRVALDKVGQWFRTQQEFSKWLLNPVLPLDVKEKGIREILPPDINESFADFTAFPIVANESGPSAS